MTPAQPGADEPEPDSADGTDEAARLRPRKAPNAFRTISEVADDLHIPQHVLRFWETKFPQVKPLKRGGGRRYYRPDDIALLRRISGLLYVQGYTIKGVQRLLREGGGKLSDDIPPPTPEDLAEVDIEPDAVAGGQVQDEPQLPIGGLLARPPMPAPHGQPARAAAAPVLRASTVAQDAEISRLRGLLVTTLRELESLRALLA